MFTKNFTPNLKCNTKNKPKQMSNIEKYIQFLTN